MKRLSKKRFHAIVAEVNAVREHWDQHCAAHRRLSKLLGARTISDENAINELANNDEYTIDQLLADFGLTRPA